MSSWCCSTCPYPNPRPPYAVNPTTYPRVTAAPYALYARLQDGEAPKWFAPVFVQPPGKCASTIQQQFYPCDTTLAPINVYIPSNALSGLTGKPAGYPVLSPRSCSMRVCTSSSENVQQSREEGIRINVQNGTWCKTPMSSSEFLEYSKAMDGVHHVYVAPTECC